MSPIAELLAIMARLRDPERGCSWDLQQDFASIAPYAIEEAYEVGEAIAAEDYAALRDELGDLLLQVVFHAQLASERELFDFDAVAAAICGKLIRRHPHVFAGERYRDAAEQRAAWERVKTEERRTRGEADLGVLGGVPAGLPAFTRASKLQQKAAAVGFDWDRPAPVLDKLDEELRELRGALGDNGDNGDNGDDEHVSAAAEELGDVLFACVNLARHLRLDPDQCLRRANYKFERRFRSMEHALRAQGRDFGDANIDELECLWQQAKERER